MKKILFAAALFISTGLITSCSKEAETIPTNISKNLGDIESGGGGRLGTGDGDIDRPPVRKPSVN
jgi:hypothetical protein